MADFTVTAGELVEARAALESHLPGTAIIQRNTTASDGQGGVTATYSSGSTVAARLAPATADERITAGRIADIEQYMLTVPAATAIDATDQVVYAGVTYQVASVRSVNEAPWDLSTRVIVTRID